MRRSRSLAALAAVAVWLTGLPAHAKAPDEFNMFVWQVSKPGSAHADYLAGTEHLPIPKSEHLPARVRHLLNHADVLVTEVDVTNVTPALVAKYSQIPAGEKSLSERLGPTEWQKLIKIADAQGLNPDVLDHMAPWLVAMQLSLPVQGDPMDGMDHQLERLAAASHVRQQFLETAEEQMACLAGAGDDENLGMLEDTIDQPNKADKELDELLSAYRSGDLKQVERALFDPHEMKRYPHFYHTLFDARNARWIPKLTPMFDHENVFVAVGLGHLVGAHGLIAQLHQRGYQVTRVAL